MRRPTSFNALVALASLVLFVFGAAHLPLLAESVARPSDAVPAHLGAPTELALVVADLDLRLADAQAADPSPLGDDGDGDGDDVGDEDEDEQEEADDSPTALARGEAWFVDTSSERFLGVTGVSGAWRLPLAPTSRGPPRA
jgi:hypothetical protein